MADTLRISERPSLTSPVLIAAFRGWNDGGQGASLAGGYLAKAWGAARFAEIDPEEFYDFQATRPQVSLVEGSSRRIDWPDNAFYHAHIPGQSRDAVLLLGIEPNVRWRTFSGVVTGLARDFGVELVVTLGSLLADVPHTRPSPVTGAASDPELIERLGLQASRYEGPTGIVGVLHHALAGAGVPSASLWASVPHYVAASPNPKVALALVRAFEGAAGLAVDAGELESAAEDYERQVSAAVASDPEVKAFVERLETAMDEVQAENPPDEGSLPSADTIARDFQRFLRQRGPEEPGQTS
jgi:proteasome assembly chaperone (PAC2) family protein